MVASPFTLEVRESEQRTNKAVAVNPLSSQTVIGTRLISLAGWRQTSPERHLPYPRKSPDNSASHGNETIFVQCVNLSVYPLF